MVPRSMILRWINKSVACDQHYVYDAMARGYGLVDEIMERRSDLISRYDFLRSQDLDPDLKFGFRFNQDVPKEGKRGFRWDIEKD
jgi:hypothetical protein